MHLITLLFFKRFVPVYLHDLAIVFDKGAHSQESCWFGRFPLVTVSPCKRQQTMYVL